MHKIDIHPDTYLGSVLVLFIIMILGLLAVYPGVFPAQEQRTVVCSEETKVCADGSVVTRGGDACKFGLCPSGEGTWKKGITEEPFEVPVSATPVPAKKPVVSEKTLLEKKEVLCTMEVRLCSDGSFVGRVAPTCDFAPCPDDLELDADR